MLREVVQSQRWLVNWARSAGGASGVWSWYREHVATIAKLLPWAKARTRELHLGRNDGRSAPVTIREGRSDLLPL